MVDGSEKEIMSPAVGLNRILKMAESRQIPKAKTSYVCEICVLGIFENDFGNRHISISTSRTFHLRLTYLDDIHLEKGACGGYKNEEKRALVDLSLPVTILSWKKAPATGIKTNTNTAINLSFN